MRIGNDRIGLWYRGIVSDRSARKITGKVRTQTWLYFFLIWLLPQLTILNGTARVRMISEHIGLEEKNELTQSRHVEGTWWERMCLSPLNSNFHLAHHLFPAVPLYNLPKLHHLLMSDRVYRTKGKIYPNYLSLKNGVLADLVL